MFSLFQQFLQFIVFFNDGFRQRKSKIENLVAACDIETFVMGFDFKSFVNGCLPVNIITGFVNVKLVHVCHLQSETI